MSGHFPRPQCVLIATSVFILQSLSYGTDIIYKIKCVLYRILENMELVTNKSSFLFKDLTSANHVVLLLL